MKESQVKQTEFEGTKESKGNDSGDTGQHEPDGLAESQQSNMASDVGMEETQESQTKSDINQASVNSDIDQASVDEDGQTLSQAQIQYQNLMKLAATMQQSQTSTDGSVEASNKEPPKQDGNGSQNTENKGGRLPLKKRIASSSSEDEPGDTDEDVVDDDNKDEDLHSKDSPGISSKKTNKTSPHRRIAATDESGDSDPDGLKDVPSDSSERVVGYQRL